MDNIISVITGSFKIFGKSFSFITGVFEKSFLFLTGEGKTLIINIQQYIWDNISFLMNEILNKYYGNSSYFDILVSSFNPSVFSRLIENTKKEFRIEFANKPSTNIKNFPLPPLPKDPPNVTFPSIIKLIIQTLFTLIITCIIILVISIISNLIYIIFKLTISNDQNIIANNQTVSEQTPNKTQPTKVNQTSIIKSNQK